MMSQNRSTSSLEAAAEAAAKVNAMLIAKGKLKPSQLGQPKAAAPVNKPKQQQSQPPQTQNNLVVAEVEINSVPIGCRNMLTRGSTQDEISKMSGAAVSTRGRYMTPEDRTKNNMGERPLYLCVQGPTKESVDVAVVRIKEIISNGMRPKMQKMGQRSSGAIGSPPAPTPIVTVRGPRPPILNQPPPPLMSINIQPASSPPLLAVGENRFIDLAQPPPALEVQDKLFIGLEHAPPSFDCKGKLLGPGGAFLQHISNESGARVTLRGKGSGFPEPNTGRESFEGMHIHIQHPNVNGLLQAKGLAENLIQTVQSDYAQFQQALASMPQTTINPGATFVPGIPQQTSGGITLMNQQPGLPPGVAISQQPPAMSVGNVGVSTSLPSLFSSPMQPNSSNIAASGSFQIPASFSQPVSSMAPTVAAVSSISQPGFQPNLPGQQFSLSQPSQHVTLAQAQPGHPGAPLQPGLPASHSNVHGYAQVPLQQVQAGLQPGQQIAASVQQQVQLTQQAGHPLPAQPFQQFSQPGQQQPQISQPQFVQAQMQPQQLQPLPGQPPVAQQQLTQVNVPGQAPPGHLQLTQPPQSHVQLGQLPNLGQPGPVPHLHMAPGQPPPGHLHGQPQPGQIQLNQPPPGHMQPGQVPPPGQQQQQAAQQQQQQQQAQQQQIQPSSQGQAPTSQTYYQQYLSPASGIGSVAPTTTTSTASEQPQKRRFTEEKQEEKLPDNLLGYQHGPPHLANLVSSGGAPNQRSQSLDQRRSPSPHMAHSPNMFEREQQRTASPGGSLMPPPPPPPPLGERKGELDKQLMPPPPPPNLSNHGDREPDRKKVKGALGNVAAYGDDDEEDVRSTMKQQQREAAKYSFNQYSSKPQIYKQEQEGMNGQVQNANGDQLPQHLSQVPPQLLPPQHQYSQPPPQAHFEPQQIQQSVPQVQQSPPQQQQQQQVFLQPPPGPPPTSQAYEIAGNNQQQPQMPPVFSGAPPPPPPPPSSQAYANSSPQPQQPFGTQTPQLYQHPPPQHLQPPNGFYKATPPPPPPGPPHLHPPGPPPTYQAPPPGNVPYWNVVPENS